MPYIEYVAGDYMTCPLSFKWLKNDLESFNHSGTNIYLVVQTPSGKSVDDRCTVNDAEAGISNILLKQSFVIEVGLHRAELQAIDTESGLVRMTSPSFSYNVRGSLQDSNTEEAQNTLTQLQEVLVRAEEVIASVDQINSAEVMATIAQLEALKADVTLQLAKLKDYELLESDFIALQGQFTQLLADIDTRINAMQLELTNHKNSRMPHKVKDLKANKEYTFGLQVSAEGNPQIIFEEVM